MGSRAAAETYFDKPAKDLSIAESATLIGLLWSPSNLEGDRNGATVQRNLVLQKMFNNGYISEDEYTRALDKPLPEKWPMAPVLLDRGLDGSQVSREFASLVQDELVDELGARAVFEGGLEVHTTLDLEAQVAAREILYGPAGIPGLPGQPGCRPRLHRAFVRKNTGYGRGSRGEFAVRPRDPGPAAARQFIQDLRAHRCVGAGYRPRDHVPIWSEVLPGATPERPLRDLGGRELRRREPWADLPRRSPLALGQLGVHRSCDEC